MTNSFAYGRQFERKASIVVEIGAAAGVAERPMGDGAALLLDHCGEAEPIGIVREIERQRDGKLEAAGGACSSAAHRR